MAIGAFEQPELIEISNTLRLRKFDGRYEVFLPGYQNPTVYQNSEGIFDESKIPDLAYVEGMCKYLVNAGELYYIEVKESGEFRPIGDITIKEENPPIAIWFDEYRGKQIGTLVMKTMVNRLKELGFKRIKGSSVYRWNIPSQKMHEKLGFQRVREDKDEFYYDLDLNE